MGTTIIVAIALLGLIAVAKFVIEHNTQIEQVDSDVSALAEAFVNYVKEQENKVRKTRTK